MSKFSKRRWRPHNHGAVQDGEGLPVAFTLAQRRAIAESWPEFADRLHLDVPNRTLYLNQNEVQHLHDKALLGELNAKGGMQRNSFRHIIETTRITLSRVEAFGTIPVTDSVYQFKVPKSALSMHFEEKVVYLFHRRPRCAEPGCGGLFYAKGLCRTHYRHWKRGSLEPTEVPAGEVWRGRVQNQ